MDDGRGARLGHGGYGDRRFGVWDWALDADPDFTVRASRTLMMTRPADAQAEILIDHLVELTRDDRLRGAGRSALRSGAPPCRFRQIPSLAAGPAARNGSAIRGRCRSGGADPDSYHQHDRGSAAQRGSVAPPAASRGSRVPKAQVHAPGARLCCAGRLGNGSPRAASLLSQNRNPGRPWRVRCRTFLMGKKKGAGLRRRWPDRSLSPIIKSRREERDSLPPFRHRHRPWPGRLLARRQRSRKPRRRRPRTRTGSITEEKTSWRHSFS